MTSGTAGSTKKERQDPAKAWETPRQTDTECRWTIATERSSIGTAAGEVMSPSGAREGPVSPSGSLLVTQAADRTDRGSKEAGYLRKLEALDEGKGALGAVDALAAMAPSPLPDRPRTPTDQAPATGA